MYNIYHSYENKTLKTRYVFFLLNSNLMIKIISNYITHMHTNIYNLFWLAALDPFIIFFYATHQSKHTLFGILTLFFCFTKKSSNVVSQESSVHWQYRSKEPSTIPRKTFDTVFPSVRFFLLSSQPKPCLCQYQRLLYR